jgi:hypothetical protein
MKRANDKIVRRLAEVDPSHEGMILEADWHIQGLIYHARHMVSPYRRVAQEVANRALGNADVIIMYSPHMQRLAFEFYAFMNLARITLDQVVRYAKPTFGWGAGLPNSIKDVLKYETDCPIFIELSGASRASLNYLIDIRDCLIHHQTFATSDNTVAVREGFDDSELDSQLAPMARWPRPPTRAYFRRLGGASVSVNIVLPDRIYHYDALGKQGAVVRPFTYSAGINVLSAARDFTGFCMSCVWRALTATATGEKYSIKT